MRAPTSWLWKCPKRGFPGSLPDAEVSWSNGVMKSRMKFEFRDLLFPILQHSSTPKQVSTLAAKPLFLKLAPRIMFFKFQ
jgi:hypothetical protein